jgi:hypothetical protein
VGTESIILIVVAMAGLGAFVVGVILLVLYFRYRSAEGRYSDEPVVYGRLVQCPYCGYMNPLETGACLNCRQPLPHPRGYAAPPPAPRPAVPYESAYRPSPPPGPGSSIAAQDMTASASAAPYAAPRPASAPQPAVPVPPVNGGDVPSAWLEGVGGAMMGHRAEINQINTLVGRSTSCDIQVYDPKVSRRHFLIRYANGAFFLQDQQSSRGTRINGQRVMAQRLKDGDHIEVGDSGMVFHTRLPSS